MGLVEIYIYIYRLSNLYEMFKEEFVIFGKVELIFDL